MLFQLSRKKEHPYPFPTLAANQKANQSVGVGVGYVDKAT